MSNLDDMPRADRHGPKMQTRFIAKALYETWRAWAEMRGHKTKEWTDNDDVAHHAMTERIGPFLVKRELKSWLPFPSTNLVGGKDGALQVQLRALATYLLDASPHQAAKPVAKPADAGNKTAKRYCPICDNSGQLASQGAGPEDCPRLAEPWHLKR